MAIIKQYGSLALALLLVCNVVIASEHEEKSEWGVMEAVDSSPATKKIANPYADDNVTFNNAESVVSEGKAEWRLDRSPAAANVYAGDDWSPNSATKRVDRQADDNSVAEK